MPDKHLIKYQQLIQLWLIKTSALITIDMDQNRKSCEIKQIAKENITNSELILKARIISMNLTSSLGSFLEGCQLKVVANSIISSSLAINTLKGLKQLNNKVFDSI